MHEQMFYVFGGYTTDPIRSLSTIAQYNPDTNKWTKVGDLNQKRNDHAAIVSQGEFLIFASGPTEKCHLTSNKMTCVVQGEPNAGYG